MGCKTADSAYANCVREYNFQPYYYEGEAWPVFLFVNKLLVQFVQFAAAVASSQRPYIVITQKPFSLVSRSQIPTRVQFV
jgi:hypothetical protein